LPKDVPPFRSTAHGNKPLVKDSLTYGLDDKAKQLIASRRARTKTVASVFPHEAPFKPAVKNLHETIDKFPAHMPSNPV